MLNVALFAPRSLEMITSPTVVLVLNCLGVSVAPVKGFAVPGLGVMVMSDY